MDVCISSSSSHSLCHLPTTTTAMSSSLKVILDLQCFKNNDNEFIIKEACVLNVTDGTILLHHVTKLSYQYQLNKIRQRECEWLIKHYHGLDWCSGDISYHDLMYKLTDLLARCSVIYVKGLEKKMFVISTLLPTHSSSSSSSIDDGVDEVDSSSSSQPIQPYYLDDTAPAPSSAAAAAVPLVIDMSDIGCRSLSAMGEGTNKPLASVKVRCNRHMSTRHRCALSNCTLLRSWLLVTAQESLEV